MSIRHNWPGEELSYIGNDCFQELLVFLAFIEETLTAYDMMRNVGSQTKTGLLVSVCILDPSLVTYFGTCLKT